MFKKLWFFKVWLVIFLIGMIAVDNRIGFGDESTDPKSLNKSAELNKPNADVDNSEADNNPKLSDSNPQEAISSSPRTGNSKSSESNRDRIANARRMSRVGGEDRNAVQEAEDRSSRATARARGDLTFDDLKFEMDKEEPFERSMLTEEIEELHKKQIRIRGFILPASVFRLSGFTEFVLVRDNMECCFGPGAALYDCIIVHMAKGKTADFSTRPVMVRGRFEIREFKYPDIDMHYAIYFMEATDVR